MPSSVTPTDLDAYVTDPHPLARIAWPQVITLGGIAALVLVPVLLALALAA